VDADAELHLTIGGATQNQALQKLVSGLMEMLERSREESLQTTNRRKASIDAHRRIIGAIEKHDKIGARNEMQNHIEEVEASVLPTSHSPKIDSKKPKERRVS
jgi:GntR family transcriptional repressor for pyruvate dehydrogenase complex